MPYPAVPYNICPCCGTEFGVDDQKTTHHDLRLAWIRLGMPWFDDITSPPPKWSAAAQLIDAGYGKDLIAPIASATRSEQQVIDILLPRSPLWSVSSDLPYAVTVEA
jgi:hypothetical protein